MGDTRRSERGALNGMGVRLSRWSLGSGLESGFQHGLISRSTPVRIRPPQLLKSEIRSQRSEVRSQRSNILLTSDCGPVVQRLRPLAYTQVTMVRVHPGSLSVSCQWQ